MTSVRTKKRKEKTRSEVKLRVGHGSKRRMHRRTPKCVEARSLLHTPEDNQHDLVSIDDHCSRQTITGYRM